MVNKCACGCNPQPGKLNINSKLNKDFNKVIQSPNQSELNKQLLIQQLNDKPGNMCVGGSGSGGFLPNDLVLEQLRELNEGVAENSSDIDKLEDNLELLDKKIDNHSSLRFEPVIDLPTSNIQKNVIYMKQITNGPTGNLYEEWVHTDKGWEMIGSKHNEGISLVDLELMLI